MTQKERETCTRILGFLDAVSKVESNIFSAGAEHAKRMMQEILKEEEEHQESDGPETLRKAMQKAKGNGSTRDDGKMARGIAMAALRQMKAEPCELRKYEDWSFPELCKKCPARKKEEP